MSIIVMAIGLWVLDPYSLKGLAKSAVAHSLMLANVFFYSETGYFDEGAAYKPLLHTWSLSVEEQFYAFFPLFLYFIFRRKPSYVIPAIVTVAVGSLALSIIGTSYFRSATFFLLPTRAWELLAGVMISAIAPYPKLGRWSSEIVSAVGLILILGAMFLLDHFTPFPGVAAIAPVLGAVFVIVGNRDSATLVSRFLSLKPMVFVGQMSYSLYLWHWPIIVISSLVINEITLPIRIGWIVISILLAILSLKFVEGPFGFLRSCSRIVRPTGLVGYLQF